jgi:hypothetical protein
MRFSKTRFFRTAAFLLLFASLTPAMGFSQDETEEAAPEEGGGRKKISGGYGYFTPGYLMYSLEDFNNYFAPSAFAPVKDNGISFGGGGSLFVRNIVLGGEGHNILTKKASSSLLNAQLKTGWGMFQVGYIVLAKKGLLVYPKLGIGGYTHELTLKEQLGSTTFDTITAGNYSGSMLTRRGMLGSVEANVDFMPGFDESSGGGMAFGLAVGYQMALTEKDWEAQGTLVTGGPSINPSGLYVRLRIGLGGWNMQD